MAKHEALQREVLGKTPRLFVVVALAIAILLTLTTSAFAASGSYDYETWRDTGDNAITHTPHKGYLTTTVKCAVCHSVHNAAVSGTTYDAAVVPAYAGGETQMLLRTEVADACTYCHITNNIGTIVYGGNETLYTSDSVYGHQAPDAPCVGCHSTHGANTFSGAINQYILKDIDPQTSATLANGTAIPWGPTVDDTNFNGMISYFCTNCHKYYSDASETTVTFTGYNGDTYAIGVQVRKHHPMKAFEATLTANGKSPEVGQVAWKNSTYCRDCHDAGTTNAFPHYTANAARFLLSATDFTTMSGGGAANIGANPSQDGACLKCHAQNATNGVGQTY
jgi:hypothetical protein